MSRPHLPGAKRAVVIGAGSFGTAIAVLLARGGLRTTLQTRTEEQAAVLVAARENVVYLPGVELARDLRIEPVSAGLQRADFVFLGVPSNDLAEVIAALPEAGLGRRTAVVSLSKGLVPPDGMPPTIALRERFGSDRVACLGGPAHAGEMVTAGAGLVAASTDEALAEALANVFTRAGVVCELSNDPIGVELAGAAKNAAALASGATEAQGLNAAGAAAGHIFAEIWRFAEANGARPESMIGLAGTGDLVATALAPQSRNRRAGELLAEGVPAGEIHGRVGQAVEALESVPLMARALERAGFAAPVTGALARLISGELPLEEWVALVRATVPPRAGWGRPSSPGFWLRLRDWFAAPLRRRSRGRPAQAERNPLPRTERFRTPERMRWRARGRE
ncbi:MAG: NAD(P)H-dependent glycerol-3-phosphate dehydrogenase [Solirubrobacteraceae bacterium]